MGYRAGRWLGVEELVGGNPVVDARHGARRRLAAEHEHRHVLFRVDRAFRGKAEAQQLGPEALPELRLGQQQKVGMPPPHDRQRCDEPRLGREQERFTGLAGVQCLDVVRDHALQIGRRIGSRDGNEGPRPRRRP